MRIPVYSLHNLFDSSPALLYEANLRMYIVHCLLLTYQQEVIWVAPLCNGQHMHIQCMYDYTMCTCMIVYFPFSLIDEALVKERERKTKSMKMRSTRYCPL